MQIWIQIMMQIPACNSVCKHYCEASVWYAAALEIMSVMEEDKGRNENFRRERVKKICSRELVDMLLKTPRLQHTALTAENEVGLSLGFCSVAVIAGWDYEALRCFVRSHLCVQSKELQCKWPQNLCAMRGQAFTLLNKSSLWVPQEGAEGCGGKLTTR